MKIALVVISAILVVVPLLAFLILWAIGYTSTPLEIHDHCIIAQTQNVWGTVEHTVRYCEVNK